MFCKNCGKEISDNAYVCPSCGVLTKEETKNNEIDIIADCNKNANLFLIMMLIFGLIGFFIAGLFATNICQKYKISQEQLNEYCKGDPKMKVIVGLVISIIHLIVSLWLFLTIL